MGKKMIDILKLTYEEMIMLINQSEIPQESRQLNFPANCTKTWTRLELQRTHEAIWFWPWDLTHIGKNLVIGYINISDFTTGIEYNNQWNSLGLITGRTIWFYPVSASGTSAYGYINTPDYIRVHCPPFTPPPVNGTCWNFKGGVMRLNQSGNNVTGTFEYMAIKQMRGEIVYATFWGNLLRGQWREEGRTGYFAAVFASNRFSGTHGSGELFQGGGPWDGSRISCP